MAQTAPIALSWHRFPSIDDRSLAAVTGLVAAVLAWARLPAAVRGVTWAEDGALFLRELTRDGFWPTLFKPYAGYLQFWPRVLSDLAVSVGLPHYAQMVTLLSCAAVGALGGGVYWWSKIVIARPPVRFLLASLPVLVPTAPIEVLGNLANLHWLVLWACVWLLLVKPRTPSGAVALAVLAATFALTEIQVTVLGPLLIVHRRSGCARIVRLGLLLGLTAQVVSTLAAPRPSIPDHLGLRSIVLGYFINGPLAAVVGSEEAAGALLADGGVWVAVLASVPFLACAIYALLRGSSLVRILVSTLLLASGATWFAAVWVNVSRWFTPWFGYATFGREQLRNLSYYRYGYVPSLCLLAIVLIAAAVLADRSKNSRRGPHHAELGVLIAFLVVATLSFSPPKTLRDGQPVWSNAVSAARAECVMHPRLRNVAVAQAPVTWTTQLPCSLVRQ